MLKTMFNPDLTCPVKSIFHISPGSVKKIIIILLLAILVSSCAIKINYSYLQNYNRETFEGANAVVVYDSTGVELEKDGKYVYEQHKLVKILTMKGKAMFSEAVFGYFTKYDTVIVEQAKVISPDGEVLNVSKEDIKDVKIPAFGKFFLPNVRMKKIIFPNLEEGSSVEYLVKTISKNPPMENHFNTAVIFEGTEPIQKMVFSINSPIGLSWIKTNDDDNAIIFQENKGEDKILYKWRIKDIPGIVEEPMMPPLSDISKKIVISSIDSWKDCSKWYYELCKDKYVTNDTMNAVIDSLLVGQETREDSIRVLYYYVSKNIRYVGTKMTGEKGGYEPFPATKTFKEKYGVCRDKACLLVAMLRQAGIDADIVLINPMQVVEKGIPHIAQFNHAITAVINEDGSYLFIDGTAENTSEFLMSIEQDKAALVCNEEGEDLLLTPKVPPEENLMLINAVGNISEAGELTEKATMELSGLMGMAFRQILTKLPPEQFKQIFNMMITEMISGAVLDTFYYSDPEDLNKPLEITIEFSSDDFGLRLDENFSFKFPFSSGQGTGASISIGGGGNPFALEQRKYPLFFYTTLKTEVNEKIVIPEGFKVKELPETLDEDLGFFKTESRYTISEDSITHKAVNSFCEYIFSPDEYKEMKTILDLMSQKSGQEVVLIKKGGQE